MRRAVALLVLALALVFAGSARSETVDPGSPRAAVEGYLDAVRHDDYQRATGYLQLPGAEREAGAAELAERLKFVLERNGVEPETLSGAPQGDTHDGLPPGVDRVAQVTSTQGKPEDVLLTRVSTDAGKRWLFSSGTVERVNGWYDALEERWLLDRLPAPLLRSGPFGLLAWQWLALLTVLIWGWLIGTLLGRLTIGLLKRVARRTPAKWDDVLVARKRGPVTLLFAAATCWVLLPLIDLYPGANDTVESILRLTLYVALFWALTRSADVAAAHAANSDWARSNQASRALIPLATRLLKLLVLAVAIVGLLAELGYPVASLIAGFGIGGLALALAAQKTIENLFGALSLAVDQPLREGDLVKVDNHIGTVEAIGLRSTRIRSQARSVITIPNGRVAEMTIESLALRDRMLFECKIGLVYDTSAEQLRRVLKDLEGVLRAHERTWPDSVDVHFTGYGQTSLEIEVMAWFQTTNLSQFLAIRQEVLLEFMQAISAAGSALAYSGQTLRVAAPGARGIEASLELGANTWRDRGVEAGPERHRGH